MPVGSVVTRRLLIAGLCLLSLAISCVLAWWQWNRFESASGTLQNLSYVLQWPLFGLFPAFMVYRIRKLRRAAAEAEHAPPRPDSTRDRDNALVAEVPPPRPRPTPAMAGAGRGVDEEDEELAAYNRYLAELNARDQENREKGKPAW